MTRSIKSRIRTGTVFLFIMVLLSAGFSIYYLATLKNGSKNILRSNYESLEYGHAMLKAVDALEKGKSEYLDTFALALRREKGNITEVGEGEAVAALEKSFKQFIEGDTSLPRRLQIREEVHQVLLLNMAAIQIKSQSAEKMAENALSYQIGIASVLFIIGLTFAYNFPSVLTVPIYKLTEAIREIAAKNYRHRVHIESRDELGALAGAFNDMAERLEYFESSNLSQILFEKTRAEAVVNSLRDASLGIDQNGVILFANQQALQLLGLRNSDIVGKKSEEVSERNDLFRFLVKDKTSTPFKAVVEGRENYFIKEGMDVEISGASSRVIVVKNITSFKELDVAKTNFIATVSHELKTPLASSDFSLRLLDDPRTGGLSVEQKELLESLKGDNRRMLRILSELLNMAQVEAGQVAMDIRPVDAKKILENAVGAVQNASKDKSIRVCIELEDNLPIILADEEKTSWVLTNLLSNAVKHAPVSSTVSVRVARRDSKIEISVMDEGPGIAAEYLEKIFERFFKVPGSKSEGTGLGLAICKEFIEAEEGEIWVKSEPGSGTEFGFSLRVA